MVCKETDLWVGISNGVSIEKAKRLVSETVMDVRRDIEGYIEKDPGFLEALHPYSVENGAPEVVLKMVEATLKAGVGPMAAVAGAISGFVGVRLREVLKVDKVIVENGGDIYAYAREPVVASIYAGSSPFSQRIGIRVDSDLMPVGICTSSGTVGHSLSFGSADAVTVVAKEPAVADAFATAFGNMVKSEADIREVLNRAGDVGDIIGVVVIFRDKMGARGDIQLVKM